MGNVQGISHSACRLLGRIRTLIGLKSSIDPAGRNAVDPHLSCQRHRQGVCEGCNAALSGSIALTLGLTHPIPGRGNIDNACPRCKIGYKEFRQIKWCGHPHCKGILKLLIGAICNTNKGRRRIIHQHIHTAILIDDGLRKCLQHSLVTDIPNKTGIQYAIYNDGAHAWNIYGNIFYDAGSVNIVLNGGRDNYVYENICIEGERRDVGFLVYNSDMIDEEYSSDIKIGPDEEVNATFDRLSQKPAVGSQYYDLWYSKWPLIYDFLLDFEDVDKGSQCIYYTVNYIKDNYLFGMSCSVEEGSIADKFGVFENNQEFSTDVNGTFVNPTLGDYSPLDPFAMPNNHFDRIGRY